MTKTFLFGIVLLFGSTAHAQGAKKLDAALDGLKKTLSCGSAEAVAGAGDNVFAALGTFGKAAGDDSTVVKPGPSPKPFPPRPTPTNPNPEPRPSVKLVSTADEQPTCYYTCHVVCTNDHQCRTICNMICK